MILENDTLLLVKDKINHEFNGYWTIDEHGQPIYIEGYKDKVVENEEEIREISDGISQAALDGQLYSAIQSSSANYVSDSEKNYFISNTDNSIKYNSDTGRLVLNSSDVSRNFAVAAGWHKDPIVPHRTNLYITSAYENDGDAESTPEPFMIHRPRIAFKDLIVTSSVLNYLDPRYSRDFKYQNTISNILGFLDNESRDIEYYIPNMVFRDSFLHHNTISSTCEVYNLLNNLTGKYQVNLKFWSNKDLTNVSIPLIMFTKGEMK